MITTWLYNQIVCIYVVEATWILSVDVTGTDTVSGEVSYGTAFLRDEISRGWFSV